MKTALKNSASVLLIAAFACLVFAGDPLELLNRPHAWADGPPETIRIPADYPTIQQGIDAAMSGDTVLVSPGTYYENIDFTGKALVVTSTGGPRSTVIDGGGLGTVVTAASGEPEGTAISQFTLRNGDKGHGGGILCDNCSRLRISSNYINSNSAYYGGGVCVENSSEGLITNCMISNNGGSTHGGGVYSRESDILIYRNIIRDNLDTGVYSYKSLLEIDGNEITGNWDSTGGGITSMSCLTAVISNNVITNNENSFTGGGGLYLVATDSIFVFNNTIAYNIAIEEGSNVKLYNSPYVEFRNNIIAFGIGSGGIYSFDLSGECIFEYNDVYGNDGFDYFNVAPGEGSMSFDPLLDEDCNLDWRSPCIDMGDQSITPPAGGGERIDMGVHEFQWLDNPPVTIEALSIPDTIDTGSAADWSLSLVNGSLQSQYIDCFVSFMKVDDHISLFEQGIMLGPGETGIIGDEYTFGEFFEADDWEIIARAARSDSIMYELDRKPFHVFRAPRIIDVPGDFDEIQQAIDVAIDGDTILVGAGTYEETLDYLGKGVIVVSASGPDSTKITDDNASYIIKCEYGSGGRGYLAGFTIDREGWSENTAVRSVDFALTVLECRFLGWERAIYSLGDSDLKVSGCEISGCTRGILIEDTTNLEITGSRIFDNYSSMGVFGGGIGCSGASTCFIEGCRFFSIYNYCSFADTYGYGGGVGLSGSSFCRIENSELLSNTANEGGGIYMGGFAVLEMENSIISYNSCRGITMWHDCSATISNCFINNNSGADQGGGGLAIMHNSDGVLVNTEICGNTASQSYGFWYAVGGGINICSEGDVRLTHCIIRDNTCTVTENANPMGGGIYKAGDGFMSIENTEVTGNNLLVGWGTCYPYGAGVYLVAPGSIKNTIIYRNTIDDGLGWGGGLTIVKPVTAANLVIYENSPDQVYAEAGPSLTFSNIQDGWPGEGNIDADPLFVAPSYDHYSLSPGSPCIDTGDPTLTDPDGTRSDMGAYGGPGAKPVNMTLPVTSLSAGPGDTLEFDIILSNSTSGRIDATIHAILRSRADLADVRLLGNGELSLPTNTSRLITASGLISPELEPGDYYIHLYTTNNLKNDPIEFCNINLEITG